MDLKQRMNAFAELGKAIANVSGEVKSNLFEKTALQNPWFNSEQIEMAFKGIRQLLIRDRLEKWAGCYQFNSGTKKKVGVVQAGNIPMVGFHDILCVLVSGHELKAKLSSQDSVLIGFLIEKLVEIEPEFGHAIHFEERLKNLDAVIATGSDNTSRYFEYYFRSIPHIIRKNRTSCAVLMGEENENDFAELGKDVFSYYGLGCRNVSKLFVPEDFDFAALLKSWESFNNVLNHHKYANNYDYNKAVLLVNRTPFFDSGFSLLSESSSLVSPVSVVYYEYYKNQEDLRMKLGSIPDKIQCIVSAKGWYPQSIPFGKAQFPDVWDYADNVDTMKFLEKL